MNECKRERERGKVIDVMLYAVVERPLRYYVFRARNSGRALTTEASFSWLDQRADPPIGCM